MVKVFRRLKDTGALDGRWRLTLVGQVHRDQIAYLERVRELAEGYPIDFHIDVPLAELQEVYRKSAIYWHATGLNEDMNKHPELFEHFGISTIEAMAYGCVPIVIRAAGQTEIIEHEKSGFLFEDEDELMTHTQYCADLFMRNQEAFSEVSSAAIERSGLFSRSLVKERFRAILEADGLKSSGDALL
jgi:glycosyltransferase involved in cell wall biosynthesis